MIQKERMFSGFPYMGWLDGLEDERTECKREKSYTQFTFP